MGKLSENDKLGPTRLGRVKSADLTWFGPIGRIKGDGQAHDAILRKSWQLGGLGSTGFDRAQSSPLGQSPIRAIKLNWLNILAHSAHQDPWPALSSFYHRIDISSNFTKIKIHVTKSLCDQTLAFIARSILITRGAMSLIYVFQQEPIRSLLTH